MKNEYRFTIDYRISRINEDISKLKNILNEKINKYEITNEDLLEINKYKKNLVYLEGAVDELECVKHMVEYSH
ncbi:TPA: hypothetical protein PTV74_003227 [Clostridium botulinum]|nr:hypothetical protein [Clostridium botulinum]HDK7206382.1 hypothetical protein [Clostridium botulinum]HDK7210118.1 hypothetical protein [Clostridium botulinum]HDK7265567.1 hypothetical protein [Clostridium botulinum]HDK7269415.1 hypothetical protein [Clostridium botulinum]